MSQAKFDRAVQIVKELPSDGPVQLSQEEKLVFYKYFKQATEGDNTTPKPGLLDFVGKAKWNAWNEVKGLSKEEAMAKYVEELTKALNAASDDTAKQYLAELESL